MAKSKIPQSLERRHLLQRDTSKAQLLAIGEAYLAEDRQIEALDFHAKAGATEPLTAMLEDATEAGDSFLVRAVASALDLTPDAARWNRVRENAEAAGKLLHAETARRQAEIDEE